MTFLLSIMGSNAQTLWSRRSDLTRDLDGEILGWLEMNNVVTCSPEM